MVAFLEQPTLSLYPAADYASSPATRQRSAIKPAERRLFTRLIVSATAIGKRLDHTLAALRQRHVSLDLRDVSAGGLSALCESPVERGERLVVTFPPRRDDDTGRFHAGWDAFGRVIRCQASGVGYRVAVEFDARSAAA